MITLEGIKALLMIAGVHRLKIDFDDEQELVNAEYVFKGESGTKQITYQEIIDSLKIGPPVFKVYPKTEDNQN